MFCRLCACQRTRSWPSVLTGRSWVTRNAQKRWDTVHSYKSYSHVSQHTFPQQNKQWCVSSVQCWVGGLMGILCCLPLTEECLDTYMPFTHIRTHTHTHLDRVLSQAGKLEPQSSTLGPVFSLYWTASHISRPSACVALLRSSSPSAGFSLRSITLLLFSFKSFLWLPTCFLSRPLTSISSSPS